MMNISEANVDLGTKTVNHQQLYGIWNKVDTISLKSRATKATRSSKMKNILYNNFSH